MTSLPTTLENATTTPPRALVVSRQATPGRVAATLLGAGLEIDRAASTAAAHELATRQPYRLVVLVDPLPMFGRFLDVLRKPGSPSRNAGVVVVAPEDELPSLHRPAAPANRVVALERLEQDLPTALGSLLSVAPRSPMRAWARLAGRTPQGVAHALCRTLNLSTTGMLLRGPVLPVGTELSFELRRTVTGPTVGGRARVVRHGNPLREPAGSMGLQILDLADGGTPLLEHFVRRAGTAVLGETVPPGGLRLGRTARPGDPDDLEHDLLPGLLARLRSPDWYLTGVELGLESLRDFQEISALVFRGDAMRDDARQHLARLEKVHAWLADFAAAGSAVEQRVMIMVEARPFLERLVEDLECGRGDGDSIGVRRVVGQIGRMVANRDSLARVRAASEDLLSPALALLRWRRRQAAERFFREHRALLRVLGFAGAEELATGAAVRRVQASADAEIQTLDERLRRIHRRIYVGRFAVGATGDIASDLAEAKVASVLDDVLASGREYLERAFSVYRHALELQRGRSAPPPTVAR